MAGTSKNASASKKSGGFTAEERAAMRARAKELKAEQERADGESQLLEAIAKMPDADRTMAEAVHAAVMKAAPDLAPKTWYGMPAYAKDGNVICFFRNASKFKTRYATFGFSDRANLDDGAIWPTDYALMKFGPSEAKQISALVKKAVS